MPAGSCREGNTETVCVSGVCAAQTRCSQSDPADPEGSAGVYGGGTLSASLSHPLQSHALIS